jgi:VRR-NUC domain-containing protein
MLRSALTPQIARLMSKEDQEFYGFAVPGVHTKDEAHPPVKTGTTERREQGEFWNWLCLNGYDSATIWHRTDKATGATRGTPDFIVPIWGPERVLYIEFKLAGSWLSEAQEAFREGLENKGHTLYVCFSAGEAIALVKQKDRLL